MSAQHRKIFRPTYFCNNIILRPEGYQSIHTNENALKLHKNTDTSATAKTCEYFSEYIINTSVFGIKSFIKFAEVKLPISNISNWKTFLVFDFSKLSAF